VYTSASVVSSWVELSYSVNTCVVWSPDRHHVTQWCELLMSKHTLTIYFNISNNDPQNNSYTVNADKLIIWTKPKQIFYIEYLKFKTVCSVTNIKTSFNIRHRFVYKNTIVAVVVDVLTLPNRARLFHQIQSIPIQWGITGAGGTLFARILQSSSHTNWHTAGTG